jgi:hypothetical protein
LQFNGGVLQANTAISAAQLGTINLFGSGGTNNVNSAFPTITGANSVTVGTLAINVGGNASQTRTLYNNLTSGSFTVTNSVNLMQAGTGVGTLFLGGSGVTNFQGVISNGAGGAGIFQYAGTGSLNLTADNTYTGATTLFSGTTTLSGNGRLGTTSGTTVNHGAVLTLDNNVSGNPTVADRLGNKPLTLNGATLNFIGLLTTGSTEGTAGNTLTFNAGQSTVNITNNGGTTQLNFTTLTTNAGAAVNWTSNGTFGGNTRVVFSTAPTLLPATTGILPPRRDQRDGLCQLQ